MKGWPPDHVVTNQERAQFKASVAPACNHPRINTEGYEAFKFAYDRYRQVYTTRLAADSVGVAIDRALTRIEALMREEQQNAEGIPLERYSGEALGRCEGSWEQMQATLQNARTILTNDWARHRRTIRALRSAEELAQMPAEEKAPVRRGF